MKTKTHGNFVQCLTFLCLCLTSTVLSQDEIGGKAAYSANAIDKLVQQYPTNAQVAYDGLTKMGPRAIPRLVEIISDDTYGKFSPILKRSRLNPFLISVIEKSESEVAERALIRLLKSDDNIIKGATIISLGTRKSENSVPCLAKMLDDTSTYISYSVTDSPKGVVNEHTSISDVAINALQEITNKILEPDGNSRAKADAWKQWFKKRRVDRNCP